MNASFFSMLNVDPMLEKDGALYQLQALSDADEGADLLGTKNTDEVQKRWIQIANTTESLAKSHTDGRLELLRYRADLRLHGIYAALGRLVAAHGESPMILGSGESHEPISDISVPFEVGCYFFSDVHLREFTSACLHHTVTYTPSTILQALQGKPIVVKGVAKPDPALQKMHESLGGWVRTCCDIIPRLRAAREFFYNVEHWLLINNSSDIVISAKPVQQWLSRLEDWLDPYVASQGTGSERAIVVERSPLGATTPENGEVATDDMAQQPHVLSGVSQRDAKSRAAAGLVIEHLTREDVIDTLRALCQWYAQHEPGSPAPYFLLRAIRSMNADFISILQDLLPESVGAFERMVGMGGKK